MVLPSPLAANVSSQLARGNFAVAVRSAPSNNGQIKVHGHIGEYTILNAWHSDRTVVFDTSDFLADYCGYAYAPGRTRSVSKGMVSMTNVECYGIGGNWYSWCGNDW